MLDRKTLLNGKSFLPFEQLDVPELGGIIGLQGLTAGEALEFYRSIKTKKGEDGMDAESLAKLIVRSVVDDKRERIYTDDEWELVLKWPHAALQRVALVAMRINGSAEGNAGATPGDGSSSN